MSANTVWLGSPSDRPSNCVAGARIHVTLPAGSSAIAVLQRGVSPEGAATVSETGGVSAG
ncbi:hypothetical protein Ntsu_18070 [Nocardia sp. IFM 10818]